MVHMIMAVSTYYQRLEICKLEGLEWNEDEFFYRMKKHYYRKRSETTLAIAEANHPTSLHYETSSQTGSHDGT